MQVVDAINHRQQQAHDALAEVVDQGNEDGPALVRVRALPREAQQRHRIGLLLAVPQKVQ